MQGTDKQTITVSGLAFKPQEFVLWFEQPANVNAGTDYAGQGGAYDQNLFASYVAGEARAWFEGSYFNWFSGTGIRPSYGKITINANGFTADLGQNNFLWKTANSIYYRWVAWAK